jgi:hypothetical protein
VVPNRRGIWAWAEKTPFGYGRPFTRGQLTALLRDTMFSPLGWSEALAAPPIRRRPWVRTGNTWEQIGIALWGAFAGVIIVEATKQLYGAASAGTRPPQPALAGAGAPAASARAAGPEADGYCFLTAGRGEALVQSDGLLQNPSPSRRAGR